jgi:hypothetical protein
VSGLVEKLMGVVKNKQQILKFIEEDIGKYQLKSYDNFYGENAIIIHKSNNYMLRLVVWQAKGLVDEYSSKVFAEDLFHNHNFQILTVGVWGPGYGTTMYSIEDEVKNYEPGDNISLVHEGSFTLEPGSVLFMDEYRDLHIQYLPNEVSVSLNIIATTDKKTSQLIVDHEKSKVISVSKQDNLRGYMELIIDKL